jgi:hypothetical protein
MDLAPVEVAKSTRFSVVQLQFYIESWNGTVQQKISDSQRWRDLSDVEQTF